CRGGPGKGRTGPVRGFEPGRARRADQRGLPQDPPAPSCRASARCPLPASRKALFRLGNEGFRVWRAYDAVVGMCICNDRRWPETWRVMGLQGVEIVALGYNTPIANIHHREPEHLRMFHHLLSLQAGAYQNAAWVLAAAKCGAEDGHAMIGDSAIVAPTGEIAALALTEEDELITTTLDLELGEYLRRTVFNFEKHRRTEHYGLITSRTGAKTEV